MRDTGPDKATRTEVYARAGYKCERCGNGDGPFALHHRKPRQSGGTSDPAINDPSNLVLLCEADHLDIESHRTQAYADGWLVHSWQSPEDVPIVRPIRFFPHLDREAL